MYKILSESIRRHVSSDDCLEDKMENKKLSCGKIACDAATQDHPRSSVCCDNRRGTL